MYDYEKAILHVDGDAFFASCEQATNPKLRNKPIVIGYERGAATAFSYEAKALGITRGMRIRDIKRQFPEAVLVSSDYKKYSLYSERMKKIALEVSRKVEKTSIDECYIDITGLDKQLQVSYIHIAHMLQERLGEALGMTFSIGMGPTKTLAKIGSAQNKPHGLTVINKQYLQEKVYKLPISYVPGIGYQTVPKMQALGIYVINDFISLDQEVLRRDSSKPHRELYQELQGIQTKGFEIRQRKPKSISKIHAFDVPTNDIDFLSSELSRHCETISRKLRNQGLGTLRIVCGLKTFDEVIYSKAHSFDIPVVDSVLLYKIASKQLLTVLDSTKKYRATYVGVSNLVVENQQGVLFETEVTKKVISPIHDVINEMEKKYGVGMLTHASSGQNARVNKILHANPLLKDISGKKVLKILYLGNCG